MDGEAEIPAAGRAETMVPGIDRVVAPNPGPMTYWGTNSYLIGHDQVVVVDPGPDDAAHRAALLGAIGTRDVAAILVTHAHRDHSSGASALAEATGAEVCAFGAADAGRSRIMQAFAAEGGLGGGEGVDTGFVPDVELPDLAMVEADGLRITAHHTPGHFGGHLAFSLGDVILTGDLVMGWSTTLISPPDGDVRDFRASCARLGRLGARLFLPGHGPPITDPASRLAELLTHRAMRESAICQQLVKGPASAQDLAAAIYTALAPELLPAAARNVLAHLLDLKDQGKVAADGPRLDTAVWALKSDDR